ncbi:TetR/AcrR family transcriptional regulator [Yinghuangia sp. YIM S09857]|uniref:TetR/AcrR family transcriptional regulator n=1 Tax=Yinghuangia sp. YIM S09857 TaxID=3436929 RepID=UPI003F5358AF
MPTEHATTPERRSRLTPERAGELYDAVIELLREVGYEALTMDAVAARARTSKATLYRQWQGKPGVVIHALAHLRPVSLGGDDTGSLEGDLRSVARHLAGFAREDGALLASMSHAVITNQELGDMLREVLIQPEREAFDALVQRAVARGELARRPAATDHCGGILVHAVLNRPLCDGEQATEAYLNDVIDSVVLPALLHS